MQSRADEWDDKPWGIRQYVEVLSRRWLLILVVTLLAAVLAFLYGALQRPRYEARALVVVGQPSYVLNFDERVEYLAESTLQGAALATLAMGDEVLSELLEESQDLLAPERRSLDSLRSMTSAVTDRDPSLLKLSVLGPDPTVVAPLANAWARVFVDHANRVYGVGGSDVTFLEVQLQEAEEALDESEQTLVSFQSQNELPVLTAEYASLQSLQAEYLAEQRRSEALSQDLDVLRRRLERLPAGGRVGIDEQLGLLTLTLRAVSSGSGTAEMGVDLQLALGDAWLSEERTVAQALEHVDAVRAGLGLEKDEISQRLKTQEADLMALQGQIELLASRRDRLIGTRGQALETYQVLVGRLEAARIAAADSSRRARIGSTASVPERPVGRRTLFNTGLGAVVGLLVSVGVVMLQESWRAGPSRAVAGERSQGSDAQADEI